MSSPSTVAAATPAPPDGTSRAPVPDVARGLMLALIALANVMIYLHDRPYGLRQHVVEDGTADNVTTALLVTFVDGRAYPLFAALFGYGLVRIADRARARGVDERGVTSVVRRRSAWLVVFGLVHALLAFSGDVLGWYGLLGVVLAARTRASDRVLLWWAAVWLVVASAVQGLLYADPRITDQRGFLWSFAIADPFEALGWRAVEWLMTPVGLLSVVSAVLVGMWAGKRRLLERPERHRPLLRRVAAWGIPLGVLGGVGTALATVRVWEPAAPVVALLAWAHVLTGVLGGLGYLAAIALVVSRHDRGPVVLALRATGERSLSAYLFQTVVFASLLPAHALALGATMGTFEAAVLAVGTWLATVLLAVLLARRGRPGPAEALLRRLRGREPGGREPGGRELRRPGA